MRLYLPIIKADNVISTSDHHRRLDGKKYSRDALWYIQYINNSDKGSGNTLESSSQATEKIKSPQYLNVLNHDIKKKGTCDN